MNQKYFLALMSIIGVVSNYRRGFINAENAMTAIGAELDLLKESL